jgi:hypothetical protein
MLKYVSKWLELENNNILLNNFMKQQKNKNG